MLHLALAVLRWRPDDVWRATPRELALALGPRAAPVGRADLAALMSAFPDTQGDDDGRS